MLKTFGVSMMDTQPKKTIYKHETLIELYGTGNLEEGRKYLSEHIGYFIGQSKRAVTPDLILWTSAEAMKVVDDNLIKQIRKHHLSLFKDYGYDFKTVHEFNMLFTESDDNERYILNNIRYNIVKNGYKSMNPIKVGRYLIWRLWGHLMNLHKEKIRKGENEFFQNLSGFEGDSILMETDHTELELRSMGLNDLEVSLMLSVINNIPGRDILFMTGLNKSRKQMLLEKVKKKIRNYFYSQGIGNEIGNIPPEGELGSS